MNALDLRPLSLGEIMDRTFTLYRRYFLLFLGIAGIPQIVVYPARLLQLAVNSGRVGRAAAPGTIAVALIMAVAGVFAYLFSQGATVFAVSNLYLGRPISLSQALERVRGHLGFLFGVVILNGLATLGALILLVIPGIYVACRLLVCVPVALIEERSPRESLSRSWDLTKGFAGRAFMIFLLYLAIAIAANMLFNMPFSLAMVAAAKNPSSVWFWAALAQAGTVIATVLTQPILLIATAIFYYDLRVSKEAFDLQFMMNPDAPPPATSSSVPSIL